MQYLQIQNINSTELRQLVFEVVITALKEQSLEYSKTQPPVTCISNKLLTKKEAAAYLKISLPTLTRYVKLGYVRAHTVAGTRMRFKTEELDRALKGLRSR